MSGNKIVIVVLVVIALLFVCSMGVGLGNNGKPANGTTTTDLQKSWGGLRGAFAPVQNVKPQDMAKGAPEGCVESGMLVIQPGQSCRYTIQSSFWPVRKQLSLRLSQGSAAQIKVTPFVQPNKPGLTATGSLSGAHPVFNESEKQQLEVYKDGGRLLILCEANSPVECQLTAS